MPPTRRTLRLFPALVPALVALCLLTSCASEGQTLGMGFLVSDTDTLQFQAIPGKAHSAHLHALSLDTVLWDERCARIDPSDIPQVQDMPHAAFWNDHFWNWAVDRMQDHLSGYECEPTYEEWLEEAKRTQCNGREWVGINTCEEQIAWCESVSLEEGRSWYEYIANPQYTADFNTHFTATHDSAGILSLEHRDWMGQYRHWCRVQATTIHTPTGLEVPTEWAYAGIDRSTWWHAIREQHEWEYHLPDSSKAHPEMHRGIYAPSEVVDYDFFLSEDSVYSLVSLYEAGGSFEHAIPIRAWEPDALNAYMEESRVGPATVSTIRRESWIDSSRCLHMEVDQIPQLHPHGRFAMVNRDIRQFRRSIIGSQDHCCRDNPAEGFDCDEEPYGHQLTFVDFNVHQVDEKVVSLMLKGTRNWGGSGFFLDPKPINVSARTGLPVPPPNALKRVSLEELSALMLEEFLKHPCGKNQEPYWRDSPEDTVLFVSAERAFREDVKAGMPFVIQDGEWHWIFDDHLSLFPNMCHQLWTIPTGVAFEP